MSNVIWGIYKNTELNKLKYNKSCKINIMWFIHINRTQDERLVIKCTNGNKLQIEYCPGRNIWKDDVLNILKLMN